MINKKEFNETIKDQLENEYKITKTFTKTGECIEYILIKEPEEEPSKEELQGIRRTLEENNAFNDYIITVGTIGSEIIININKKGKVRK